MISWGRVFQLRQRLKGNLWVLPLVGGITGSVFAQLSAPIDRALDLPSGWQYTSGAASSVLSAIVGAMIGLLGFVVTVSVLVVQQATGTLSPRYMRLWYRDRLQKVVLARYDSLRADEAPRQEPDLARLGPPAASVQAPRSGAIQAVAAQRLVTAAARHDWVLVLVHPIGDFLPADTPIIDVYGHASHTPQELAGLLALGTERTVDQDPAFALRILVDVAIRALSPAVNDPTTAVQVLDYLEDLLRSMVVMPLRDHYTLADDRGQVRLVIPGRTWGEFLALGVTEIRLYGAASPQVCRRLRAVLDGLLSSAPAERRAPITDEITRLDESIERTFPDAESRAFAGVSDRQGIGGRTREPLLAPELSPRRHDVPLPSEPADSSRESALRAQGRTSASGPSEAER